MTLDRDLEHPDITAAERTGYPAGHEPIWPVCPVCGAETDTFFKSVVGTGGIIGCDHCIITTDAWDEVEISPGEEQEDG